MQRRKCLNRSLNVLNHPGGIEKVCLLGIAVRFDVTIDITMGIKLADELSENVFEVKAKVESNEEVERDKSG